MCAPVSVHVCICVDINATSAYIFVKTSFIWKKILGSLESACWGFSQGSHHTWSPLVDTAWAKSHPKRVARLMINSLPTTGNPQHRSAHGRAWKRRNAHKDRQDTEVTTSPACQPESLPQNGVLCLKLPLIIKNGCRAKEGRECPSAPSNESRLNGVLTALPSPVR